MKQFLIWIFTLLFIINCNPKTSERRDEAAEAISQKRGEITLVIHGGAGTIKREYMTDEMDAQYRSILQKALNSGYAVLQSGGTAEEAVVASIMIMEDDEHFNAGKGAVFTHDGKNELDASVMDGKTRNAGAIAGIHRIKNPIKGAVAVMHHSPHVMMIGKGAEQFAQEQGLELVSPEYFYTERRFKALERIRDREKTELDHSAEEKNGKSAYLEMDMADRKFGTVGAVALDKDGNIFAGTSTGGMTNKKYGRVGDVPIIGAGTYADNESCGVSATGHGEYFIRAVVGHDIAARMKYQGKSLKEAAEDVVMNELVEMGGEGGIVALDRAGNISMAFNSEGMYRGYIKKGQEAKVYIYKDEAED